MPRILLRVALCCGCFGPVTARAQAPVVKLFDVPLNVVSPGVVHPFRGEDGVLYLSYHLVLTNWSAADLVLDRLDVLDAGDGHVVATYDTVALKRSTLFRPNAPERLTPETVRHLGPGRSGIVRTWIPLPAGQAPPARIIHRFTFAPSAGLQIAQSAADTNAAPVLTTAMLDVAPGAGIVISPPLSGGPWKAGGGAGANSYHLGAQTLDGQLRLPEQFAVDFQKVDSGGSILPNPFPNQISNAMFYSNRAPILAVGDGEVVLVRDGIPENVPTPSGEENMPVPLTRESSAGNQITIRLSGGGFAQYAHVAPGTIRVKRGDRVRRGEVIGLVGNSGNAKNPHLHFSVGDGPEINASQGIPWVFDGFESFGHVTQQGMPDLKARPSVHRREMPFQDAILRFPTSLR